MVALHVRFFCNYSVTFLAMHFDFDLTFEFKCLEKVTFRLWLNVWIRVEVDSKYRTPFVFRLPAPAQRISTRRPPLPNPWIRNQNQSTGSHEEWLGQGAEVQKKKQKLIEIQIENSKAEAKILEQRLRTETWNEKIARLKYQHDEEEFVRKFGKPPPNSD